jgi:hypothetical protein
VQARAFLRSVTVDGSDALDRFLRVLSDAQVRWCVVGGLAVNAYTEPVVTLDLDLIVAADVTPTVVDASNRAGFSSERFAHSINLSASDSDLRIQLQTDPRYASFIDRAESRAVLGLTLPVAAIADVLQGKVWAFEDVARRASKRQKDLADISRLLEAAPMLRAQVPVDILKRLV